ncbi:MAG: hypothetical protein Q4E47_03110 [Candidatus Saccharibacteria bacterium]|nr:hypothetical protein [Candidatus Saccharibacteria bacterium]
MSKWNRFKNRLLTPVLGLLLAVTALTSPLSATPVFADPVNENLTPAISEPAETVPNVPNTPDTPEETPEDTSEDTSTDTSTDGTSEEGATCYSQVGALGWLVCPATGFLAKGIDFLYGLIEELLVVQPVSTESSSPIFIVWGYLRNITCIIFVAFLLIIIYSQITGLGISNYGIKRTLPKLIIAAILVNLSYIVCALAVDVSNIIGASLHSFLANIGEQAIIAGGADININISFYDLFTAIAGGGVIAGLAIAVSGGALQLLLALIPVIVGGIISVLIGLATISLRQAVIIVLVVVSPLAFVCYLLPNTEKWYQKWLNAFTQMLFFYPMFSLLFGVSRLAGWLFIASANSALGVILGVAIQILPLFLAAPLMKMSGTVLGAVSSRLSKLGDKANAGVRAYVDPYKNAKRAEQIAKASQKRFNPFSGGSWMAARYARNYKLADRERVATEDLKNLNEEQVQALKRGTRIIAYDKKTGEAIYTQRPISIQSGRRKGQFADKEAGRAMTAEAQNRAIKLRLANTKLRTDNVHDVANDYLAENGITEGEIVPRTSLNGEYFFRIDQANRQKANQALADQRYVLGRYADAMAVDPKTGKHINPAAYKQEVLPYLGSDGFDINKYMRDGHGNFLLDSHGNRVLNPTGARSAFVSEADFLGKITQDRDSLAVTHTQRMQAYLDRQVTNVVDKLFAESLKHADTDTVISGMKVLAQRGDYDKVSDPLKNFFNDGNVDLCSDMSNRIAFELLQMKGGDPSLARFGKFINMETWAYTSGRRKTATVRHSEFMNGYVLKDPNDPNLVLTDPAGHDLYDPEGFLYETDEKTGLVSTDANGNPVIYRAKIDLADAIAGTKLNDIDRTFYASLLGQMRSVDDSMFPGRKPGSALEWRKRVTTNMMPAIVSALATFPSGSEQIVSMVGYLTGMKMKGGKWVDATHGNGIDHDLEHELALYNTALYNKAITPRQLIDLRSDTWGGIIERIKLDAKESDATFGHDTEVLDKAGNHVKTFHADEKVYVHDPNLTPEENEAINKERANEYAYEQLRGEYANQIEKLAGGSWSLENMKSPIREALRIDLVRQQSRGGNAPQNAPTDAPYDAPTDLPTQPAGPTGPQGGNPNNPNGQPQGPQGTQQQPTQQPTGQPQQQPAQQQPVQQQPAQPQQGQPQSPAPAAPSAPVAPQGASAPAPAQPTSTHSDSTADDDDLSTDGTPGKQSGSKVNGAILRALNELLKVDKELSEKIEEMLTKEDDKPTEDDGTKSVYETLAEMKQQESDQQKVQLLQKILDALLEEGKDVPKHPDDPVDPTK